MLCRLDFRTTRLLGAGTGGTGREESSVSLVAMSSMAARTTSAMNSSRCAWVRVESREATRSAFAHRRHGPSWRLSAKSVPWQASLGVLATSQAHARFSTTGRYTKGGDRRGCSSRSSHDSRCIFPHGAGAPLARLQIPVPAVRPPLPRNSSRRAGVPALDLASRQRRASRTVWDRFSGAS